MAAISPSADATLRLLVVDDDESIQALMLAIFRRLDVIIDSALDGGSALDLLGRHHYDVIVLDLMLPRKNGFEVIRELKADHAELLDRTIVLTAASNQMLRQLTDVSLVHRVIRKPFDLEEFVEEVFSCGHAASTPPLHSPARGPVT
jgi:CheY-like chemotaxis protein